MKPDSPRTPVHISDERIRTMLQAFAGPADPIPRPAGSRLRKATRRTLILACVAIGGLVVAVPASLALLRGLETPEQFTKDTTQPLSARAAIRQFISARQPRPVQKLVGIQRVLRAETPDGTYDVYQVRFAHGEAGTALFSSAGGFGGMAWGPPPRDCPANWNLQTGLAARTTSRRPLYITGRASARVASVEVVYGDGHTTRAALANGYFLAWITPLPASHVLPRVRLVALDAAGATLAQLTGGRNGNIRPTPRQSRQAIPCA